jgi:hypothetical protein
MYSLANARHNVDESKVTYHLNLTILADSVHSTECLGLHKLIPPEVYDDDPVCSRQVQACSTCLEGSQKDEAIGILCEQFDGFVSCFKAHLAMKRCASPSMFLADALHHFDHPSKLCENDDLTGFVFVAPFLDLLQGSLRFRALENCKVSVRIFQEDTRMLKVTY